MPSNATETAKDISELRRELARLRDNMLTGAEKKFEFPEQSGILELESRRNFPTRQFKHIHQQATLQATSFNFLNRIKSVYLVDMYLSAMETRNPMAIYASARSALELRAFLHRVKSELVKYCDGHENDWRSRGEGFFRTMIRARFATSDDGAKELLKKRGIPGKTLEPFNILECIKRASADVVDANLLERYAALSDFVHHNASSTNMFMKYERRGTYARAEGGATIVSSAPTEIFSYKYPTDHTFGSGVQRTFTPFMEDIQAVISIMNTTPESPFRTPELVKWTGNELGLRTRATEEAVISAKQLDAKPKLGRNDPCFCGSGKKYKNCCLH